MNEHFVIIGAQKSGTTAAQYHLSKHPYIYIRIREEDFFTKKYYKGIDYYHDIFAKNKKKKVTGDKTPDLCYLRYAINRLYAHFPEVKLLLFLREPVSRAYSQYNMYRTAHHTVDTFGREIENNMNSKIDLDGIREIGKHYIERGLYIDHIEYILQRFPSHQLHIVIAEKVLTAPKEEYKKILTFLGLEEFDKSFTFTNMIHKKKYREKISDDDLKKLYEI